MGKKRKYRTARDELGDFIDKCHDLIYKLRYRRCPFDSYECRSIPETVYDIVSDELEEQAIQLERLLASWDKAETEWLEYSKLTEYLENTTDQRSQSPEDYGGEDY